MIQFNNLIYQLSRKINWDIQMAAIPAGNKLDNKYNPLIPDQDLERQRIRERGEKIENVDSFDSFEEKIRGFVK